MTGTWLASAQELAVPGSPKSDLRLELMQSRTYCRAMERSLGEIKKRFPELEAQVMVSSANWQSSAFAKGCRAIEEDLIRQAGEKGRQMLKELDEKSWAEVKKLVRLDGIDEARDYLDLVNRRSKGEIEIDMVRGNLLWQYKLFQTEPEQEQVQGYVEKITHTAKTKWYVRFDLPMSWKTEESPKVDLMSFRSCYGHGPVWMTAYVIPSIDGSGTPVPANELFEAYNEADLRAEYRTLGIELTAFMKTQVNGMPALMFTRDQPFEQLGTKATRAAQVIRVYKDDHVVNFQINTLGPEGAKTAAERIKRQEPLFKMIAGSVQLITR
ncbi:MAG: hypothetical protein EOP09_18900 [Proteobacteria bacterium]|nr:MAG: hypothetical protein EOP09_18900 [Pseudomonadota bacterium]